MCIWMVKKSLFGLQSLYELMKWRKINKTKKSVLLTLLTEKNQYKRAKLVQNNLYIPIKSIWMAGLILLLSWCFVESFQRLDNFYIMYLAHINGIVILLRWKVQCWLLSSSCLIKTILKSLQLSILHSIQFNSKL